MMPNGKSFLLQGIEKKHAKLQGGEKAVVARHEAGHAVVGTAVAKLLRGQPCVKVLLFWMPYCKILSVSSMKQLELLPFCVFRN